MTVTIVQAKLNLHDPHDCTDSADELTLYHAFFDTLVRRLDQGFILHLAKSWEVSTDARVWVFHLHDGVRFHDGTLCDADAVIESLKRLARSDKGYTLGAPGVWHQYLGDAEIVADDSLTVRISLPAPIADLLDILVHCFIVAPSSIYALDKGHTYNPVGSGPYCAVSVGDDEIIAECTPTHFSGQPANQNVRWVREKNQELRQEMLLEGRAQVATDLDFETSNCLSEAGFSRIEYLAPVAIIYLLNAERGPLVEPSVRRALNLAIDRDDIVRQVMKGAAQPLRGFISPVHFGAGEGAGIEQDLDLARNLLDKAGYGHGLNLELNCPLSLPDESVHLTQVVSEQLAKIGITLTVKHHADREAYAHMVRRKEIGDLCVFDSSPLSTFRILVEKIDARQEGSWWQGYHNAKVEGLLDEARGIADDKARADTYRTAYAELQRDPPWLTLYNPRRILGLAGNHPDFTLPVEGVINVASLPDLCAYTV